MKACPAEGDTNICCGSPQTSALKLTPNGFVKSLLQDSNKKEADVFCRDAMLPDLLS
jgi:hypothetical protein